MMMELVKAAVLPLLILIIAGSISASDWEGYCLHINSSMDILGNGCHSEKDAQATAKLEYLRMSGELTRKQVMEVEECLTQKFIHKSDLEAPHSNYKWWQDCMAGVY